LKLLTPEQPLAGLRRDRQALGLEGAFVAPKFPSCRRQRRNAAGRERDSRAVALRDLQIADQSRAELGSGFGVANLLGPRVRRQIECYPRDAGQAMVGVG
jgi:hypothetical protein